MCRQKLKGIIILSVITILTMTGCSSGLKENSQAEVNTVAQVAVEEKVQEPRLNQYGEYIPEDITVKYLGRTFFNKDILWCSHGATGIEFDFQGTKCEITLLGDNSAGTEGKENHYARVGIFLNDELILDEMIDQDTETYTVYNGEEITGRVKVVKLSESAMSTIGVRGIALEGSSIAPTEEKDLKIEFIGDSITCGYGLDGSIDDSFSTATENATKTYGYKLATKLNADYSLVAFSGYGILSGYTSDGTINTDSLVLPYYDKLGKSIGTIGFSIKTQDVPWNFESFTPDIVFINLGTNDASYCKQDPDKTALFQEKYKEFIAVVREKNPKAYILCVLGTMDDTLYPAVESAVTSYQEETKDTNISAFQLPRQDEADGYTVNYHPSEATNEKTAEILVDQIKALGIN